MFERFTDEARAVVTGAQDEARALRHPFIGTEHLLLSMLGQGGAVTELLSAHGVHAPSVRQQMRDRDAIPDIDPGALATLGIDLDRVRRAAEERFGPGALAASNVRNHARSMPSGHLPFTKRAKKVLELALNEASALKSPSIGSGHILLGLIREGGGVGVELIRRAGVDTDELATEIRDGRPAA